MATPRKYDQEFRGRAVRMYSTRLAEPGESKRGAPRSAEAEAVRALRRRVAELERVNEILKTSAAFFATAELDRRLP